MTHTNNYVCRHTFLWQTDLRNVVGGKMTIDVFEQIINIICNIGILTVYIVLAVLAGKTYKWTSE